MNFIIKGGWTVDAPDNKSRKIRFNVYVIAGLYLFYIDYKLVTGWNNIEDSKKTLVGAIVGLFAMFAVWIIVYGLKGLKELKDNHKAILERIRKREEEEAQREEITKEIEAAKEIKEIDNNNQDDI